MLNSTFQSPASRVTGRIFGALALTLGVSLPGASLVGCASLHRSADPRDVRRGPLPTRVSLPQALAFPEPRPRAVRAQPVGTFGVTVVGSYSSIYEYALVPPDAVELDADVAHVAALVRYGIGARTDVELELGVAFASSGFLDSIVDGYHDLFGFPDGDRVSRETDQYALRLGSGGRTAWEMEEDELLPLDLPIRFTHILQRPDGGALGVALRFGVELPTGDHDAGAGSDGRDYDVGVLLERSSGRWTWTGGIDHVAIDTPSSYRAAGVTPSDLLLGTVGAEYRWDDRSSLLAGLRYRSAFSDDFSIKEADRPIVDLSFGVARDVGRGRWFAALHEDVLADSGPDVVLTFGFALGM